MPAILAVADGACQEGEGEHGDGAAEADEGDHPGGAGDVVDEPAHDEELGHISAGGDAAVGQQKPEVPVADDVEEGVFGSGAHGALLGGSGDGRRRVYIVLGRGREAIGLRVRGWVGWGKGITIQAERLGLTFYIAYRYSAERYIMVSSIQ